MAFVLGMISTSRVHSEFKGANGAADTLEGFHALQLDARNSAYMHMQLELQASKSTYRYAQPGAFSNSFFIARRQLVLAAEQCAINVGGHQIETSVCCLTHRSLSPLYSPRNACAQGL